MRVKLVLLLLLLCGACSDQASAPQSQDQSGQAAKSDGDEAHPIKRAGQPGPAVTLQLIDGRQVALKDIYGKRPVYLKLWATYCIPCRVQMPSFAKIYETYRNRMDIVAVNAGVGDDAEKVKAFAGSTGLKMPVAIDDGSLGAWLGMQETPFNLVVGRDGRVVYASNADGPALDAAIEQALSVPAVAGIAASRVAALPMLKPGDLVPDFALRSSTDAPVEFPGGPSSRPRAILFTATWCESYVVETQPEEAKRCRRVREQADRLAGDASTTWFAVVSHMWTAPKDLKDYEAKMAPKMPFAIDTSGDAFRAFGVKRLPAVALIDKDGRFVRLMTGDAISLP